MFFSLGVAFFLGGCGLTTALAECDEPRLGTIRENRAQWAWIRDTMPTASAKEIRNNKHFLNLNYEQGSLCKVWQCYLLITGMLLTLDASYVLTYNMDSKFHEDCWQNLSALRLKWNFLPDLEWQFGFAHMLARLQFNFNAVCETCRQTNVTESSCKQYRSSEPAGAKEREFLETVYKEHGVLHSASETWYTFYPFALNFTAAMVIIDSAPKVEISGTDFDISRQSPAWILASLAVLERYLDEVLLELDCKASSCIDCVVPWTTASNITAEFRFCRGKLSRDFVVRKTFESAMRTIGFAWRHIFDMGLLEVASSVWPLARSLSRVLRKLSNPTAALCDMYRAETFPSINLGAARSPDSTPCPRSKKRFQKWRQTMLRDDDVNGPVAFIGAGSPHRGFLPLIPWPRRSKFVSMWQISSSAFNWSDFASGATRVLCQNWVRFSGADELELLGGTTCGDASSIVGSLRHRLPHIFRSDDRLKSDAHIRVLDMAAGAGQVSSELMRQAFGVSVLAFGSSSPEVNASHVDFHILSEHGPPYFEHTMRPDVAFPLASNGFDLLYCCECPLRLASSLRDFSTLHIQEIGRILRPRGVLVISTMYSSVTNWNMLRDDGASLANALISANLYKMDGLEADSFLYFQKNIVESQAAKLDETDSLAVNPARLIKIARRLLQLVPWEACLHTRFLDAHASGSRGALGKALRHVNYSVSSLAARVTHVVWKVFASDDTLSDLADDGLVGFSAPCVKLPLREQSFDVVAAFQLDHFVDRICFQAGALSNLLQQLDFACRGGGLILLEASDTMVNMSFPGGWHTESIVHFRSGRVGMVMRKDGGNVVVADD